MQGIFAVHPRATNWSDVLDPGVDEETDRKQREQKALDDMAARAARARADPGVALPPVPKAPKLFAPPARFVVKDMPVFVIRDEYGADTIPMRPGQWGHYLVPYIVPDGESKARPYKESDENTDDVTAVEGFPGMSKDKRDKAPVPHEKKCKPGRDFVVAIYTPKPKPKQYWEVGLTQIRATLERAEAMDLAFARRMEGFGTVARAVVWDCLDPDYDAGDREAVMTQFMSKYLERFYTRQDPGNKPGAAKVSEEALQKHKAFCKAWTQKHYRTLTPAVTAPAEALASDFFSHIEPHMQPPQYKLSTAELSRLFMRHPAFAPEFAQALHFYAGSIEQGRGARNASYKQMRQTDAARITSYKRFGTLLEDRDTELQAAIRILCEERQYYLHEWTVDWYDILGQMPPVHRYFDEAPAFQGVASRMIGDDGDMLPPWLVARDV